MYDAEKHICFNLGRVSRRVHQYYESRLSPFGLTPPQYFVLRALWRGDGITLGELGQIVSLDSSTLTGVVDRLERSGDVERRANPEDRRSVLLFLTAKARELEALIPRLVDELDANLRRPFSPEEMETFERVLKALVDIPEHGTQLEAKRGPGAGKGQEG